MKPSLQEILDKIKAADETELQTVHDDFIQKGLDKRKVAPSFEVDDQVVDVPFNTLREYLQTGKATEPSSLEKDQSIAFRGRIPSFDKSNVKDSSDELDDGYYWDKNYNYEYMNPESEKRRVLGKIKK